jgi:hypothetical protein
MGKHASQRKLVEMRHCYHFATVGRFMAADLPPTVRHEMVEFVQHEMLIEKWIRTQSKLDVAAANSVLIMVRWVHIRCMARSHRRCDVHPRILEERYSLPQKNASCNLRGRLCAGAGVLWATAARIRRTDPDRLAPIRSTPSIVPHSPRSIRPQHNWQHRTRET